ncbi:Cloroperoxidase [Thozetella sp. PMI_491]|nr:Cloroperoxidase [Thozetella sp. PMI_491]
MKTTDRSILFSFAMAIAMANAKPHYSDYHRRQSGSIDTWAPAGPDDFRGPCPMMNTLANHGFLPHDGKNLTQDVVVSALGNALNFDSNLATIMFNQALVANPEPNATFFSLDNLNRHNVLEHDASMSRSDNFFGNNHVFNQTIFDTTTQFWTEEILDPLQLANGKLFRQIVSRSTNPNYTFTSSMESFSLGEVAAPIIVFGDMAAGTVNRTLVKFFFENERLPSELGWVKKAVPVTLDNILFVTDTIHNATSLITTGTPLVTTRDLHLGLVSA